MYFCVFSRYQLPVTAGPADTLTDVNVCYRRAALHQTRELWEERYHETTVHRALQRAGETLYLSPEPVVEQIRDGLGLGSLLRERFAWGRLLGYTRAREADSARRVLLARCFPAFCWPASFDCASRSAGTEPAWCSACPSCCCSCSRGAWGSSSHT